MAPFLRERLAGWVTDPRNVYFARATVNRVWAMMFGRPLLKRIEARTLEEPIPQALDLIPALEGADCVVICADHRAYDWAQIAAWSSLIVDTRNALKGVTGGRARIVPL